MNRDLRVGMGGSKTPTLQAIWRCAGELQPYLKISLDAMRDAELSSRCMDEREYKKIKDDLEADYKRKLAALELLWSVYKLKVSEESDRIPAHSLTDIVRQAVPNLGEEFSIWEIEKEMERLYPAIKGQYKKNSLSGTLTRMHQRGEIEIVRRGEGTAPAVYKRGKTFASPSVKENEKET